MKDNQIHIPTLLGLLVLISGTAAGVWLVNSKQLAGLTATSKNQPTYVTLTNITDTSFTVSWTTSQPARGIVMFGTTSDSLTQTAIDDRDQQHPQGALYLTHHVTLGKAAPLSPASSYYFVIQSGATVYNDNGKPYQTKTAPAITEPIPEADSISGTVVHTDGTPASGAIVYVILPDVTTQSSLTTSSGNWAIPLSLARSSDLSQSAIYDHQNTLSQIFIQGDNGETSTVNVTLADARSTATITLGQSYDWRTNQNPSPIPTSTTASTLGAKTSLFPLQPLGPPFPEYKAVTIFYPAVNEQPIPITRPSFLGNGPKGATLTITIESPKKITSSVKISSDGSWEWAAPEDLSGGPHKITITYTDSRGRPQKIQREFSIASPTVLSAVTPDLAFSSSPSGSLTPTPTPTPRPTPTDSPRASGQPTPTTHPTASPTPTTSPILASPSPTSLPISGNTSATTALIITGAIILFAGSASLLLGTHLDK